MSTDGGRVGVPVGGRGPHVLELSDPQRVSAIETPPPPDIAKAMVRAWLSPDSVRAPSFAPAAGIGEDVAAGNGAIALAAALRQRGIGHGSLRTQQGDEMGLPSTVLLAWDAESVSIAGSVRLDGHRTVSD